MRSRAYVLLMAALCGCGTESRTPMSVRPLARLTANARYTVATLPGFGGASQGGGINDRGWVAGYSGLPGGIRHAALWRDGSIVDLGTLGGVRDADDHAAELDTLGEAWSCAAFMPAS